MLMRRLVSIVCVCLLSVSLGAATTFTAASDASGTTNDNNRIDDDINDFGDEQQQLQRIQNRIVSWIRSKGGSFSDKLEIRKADPADPKSYLGVFAKEDIDAKENLLSIPRDCYIHVFDTAEDVNEEDENVDEAHTRNLCRLTRRLTEEMKLGEESEYAPYLAYLKTQTAGQLPVHWSEEGKKVLRKVALPGSSMVDWIEWNFQQPQNENANCIGAKDQNGSGSTGLSFEERMLELTVQRGFDTSLIPIYDMINHDNGRINTENDSIYEPEGLRVRALRNLRAGEEIFSTYDLCLDCGGVEEYWGTPEILRDFGFVEDYPHRWIFPKQEIWFEVYYDDKEYTKVEDNEEEFIFMYFGTDSNGGGDITVPSDAQLFFLENELDRLEEVGASFLEKQGSIPDREWNTILRFYEATVTDISAVLRKIPFCEKEASDDAALLDFR